MSIQGTDTTSKKAAWPVFMAKLTIEGPFGDLRLRRNEVQPHLTFSLAG